MRRERLRVGRSHVGVGLERGVDFGVVGVEVVHHHAVGLRPLVELVVGGFCHASSCVLRSAIRTNFASEAALSANACQSGPLRFLPAPRCALMSVFNFFVRFFRAKLRPFGLVCLRCAAALISIFSFCQPFPFQAAPLWLRVRHILFSRFSVFLDPYFRRFYDFFLRRKHLESLVRVIRPFGVRPRATKAKNFPA